jgi:phosphoglycolate phosphatase-like HAD superfamily hydrolase
MGFAHLRKASDRPADDVRMTEMCRSVELFIVPRVPLFLDLLLGGSGMSAAYIFDVEGTLIDCVSDTLQCRSETLAAFGVPVPSADLQLLSGMDGDEMLATLLPSLGEQARKDILAAQGERYRAVYLPRVRAFPGVRTVFTAIKSRGARIALATDCQSDELKCYRSLMNVDDLIDAIACGDEVSKGKPDPGLVELALRHLGGTSAASATMIGDTPFDAQAARRAGATAWGTLSGGHARSSLIDAGCSLVVSSVEDFAQYVQREKPLFSSVSAHHDE